MASIGSTVPDQREVDVSVVEKADLIVCDAVEEVVDRTGDMIEAEKTGVAFRHKAVSMNALMAGGLDGRLAQARMPLSKSVGGGLQDVAIAEMILTRALQAGLATPLPICFDTKTRS